MGKEDDWFEQRDRRIYVLKLGSTNLVLKKRVFFFIQRTTKKVVTFVISAFPALKGEVKKNSASRRIVTMNGTKLRSLGPVGVNLLKWRTQGATIENIQSCWEGVGSLWRAPLSNRVWQPQHDRDIVGLLLS